MEKLSKKTRAESAVRLIALFAVKQAICALVSFALSYTRLFECLPSFAIAFSAAVGKHYVASAVLGGVVGAAVFSDNLLIGIAGAACILTVGIINASVRSVFTDREVPVISFLSSMLCCTATGVTVLVSDGFYFAGLLLFVCDGIISGSAAYFFARSMTVAPLIKGGSALGPFEIVCSLASACSLIMSFARFSVFVFVPSRIAAFLLILLIAYVFGETAAGSAGILCGVALEVSTQVSGLSCCVSLCGLVSGLFVKRGRIFGAVSAVIISGMFAVISGTAQSGAVFFETAVSAIAFCLIPKKLLYSVKKLFVYRNDRADEYSQRQNRKLSQAAQAVSQISPCMERLKSGERSLGNQSKARMTAFVKENVCHDCGMNNSCWGDARQQTAELFRETAETAERIKTVTPYNLPQKLTEKCIRKNMLSAAFMQAYTNISKEKEKAQKDDRFSDASHILYDFAKTLSAPKKNQHETAVCAQEAFRKFGINASDAECCEESGMAVLKVRVTDYDGVVNKTLLAKEVSKVCGYSFDIPTITKEDKGCTLTFTQMPLLRLRTGTVQYAADESGVCGDFFITFKEEGKQYFILSDGMGTGEQASSDSQATAEIFSSLVRAGMSFPGALGTVNSALLKREDVESVATLDVMCVDLYSGETVFLKAGAAPSYILKNKRVMRVEMPSMPIGILESVSFSKKETVLSKGDAVIMISDGACAMRDDHIIKSLSEFNGTSAQELAEKVLKASGKKTDDSTVLAVVF